MQGDIWEADYVSEDSEDNPTQLNPIQFNSKSY